MLSQRTSTCQVLPIHTAKTEILFAIEQHSVTILQSPLATGKTTQIPQFLVKDYARRGSKCVACTQPRRVAAMSIAQRVADEAAVSHVIDKDASIHRF